MANKTEYILLARRRMEGTNERKKERKKVGKQERRKGKERKKENIWEE
jgi:hypothetical protein